MRLSLRKSSLRVRVASAGGIVLVVLIALFGAFLGAVHERRQAFASRERAGRIMSSTYLLERRLLDLETGVRGYALTGDRRFLAPYRDAHASIGRDLGRLRLLVVRDPAQARAVTGLEAAIAGYERASTRPVIARAPLRGREAERLTAAGKRRVDALRAQFDRFNAVEQGRLGKRGADAHDRRVAVLALVFVVGALTAFALLLLSLARSVVTPIERVSRAAQALAAGEHVRLDDGGPAELGRLKRAFNEMASSLGERQESLVVSERRAREAEHRFVRAFEGAPIGMAFVDLDGRFREVNPSLCAMLGRPADELVGTPLVELVTPEERPQALALAERIRATPTTERLEGRWVHKDGSIVVVMTSLTSVADADGRVTGVFAQYSDVSARHAAEERLRASEERHRAVVEGVSEVIFQTDPAGRWTLLNAAWERSTGFTVEEALGRCALDYVHEDDRERVLELFGELLAGAREDVNWEHRFLDREGAERWAEVEARAILDPDGSPRAITGLIRDVTERRAARRALEEHMAGLEAVAMVARVVTSDGDARTAVCDAVLHVTGGSLALLVEPDGRDLVVSASAGAALAPRAERDGSGSAVAYRSGHPLFVADAAGGELTGARSAYFQPVVRAHQTVAVLAVGWPERVDVLPERMTAVLEVLASEAAAVTERADLLARLGELARTDALTGLPNRRTWDADLDRELARAARNGRPLSVALIDLDHFKRVNDRHGHQAGDRVLKQAAGAWRALLRDVDAIARWGGEEFAVALPGCSVEEATVVLDRLRAALPGPHTCSAGVTAWDGQEPPEALMRRVDEALYAAKAAGRDRTAARAA